MTEKKYECSCGAVYTLATLPEKCTGTRDGRPCSVEHFGNWARVNEKIISAVMSAVDGELTLEPAKPHPMRDVWHAEFKKRYPEEEPDPVKWESFLGEIAMRDPKSLDPKRINLSMRMLRGTPQVLSTSVWLKEAVDRQLAAIPELPENPEKLKQLLMDIFDPKAVMQKADDFLRAVAASTGLPPLEVIRQKIDDLKAKGLTGEALSQAIEKLAENDERRDVEARNPCSCDAAKEKCPQHGVAPWLKVHWPFGEEV